MTLQTRVGKTLLKNMSEWKYRHKQGRQWQILGRQKRVARERGRGCRQTWYHGRWRYVALLGRGRHSMTSSMTGTGQGGTAQREERQKTFRELAGEQNGERQRSLMEETCPANSSKECSRPACSITL